MFDGLLEQRSLGDAAVFLGVNLLFLCFLAWQVAQNVRNVLLLLWWFGKLLFWFEDVDFSPIWCWHCWKQNGVEAVFQKTLQHGTERALWRHNVQVYIQRLSLAGWNVWSDVHTLFKTLTSVLVWTQSWPEPVSVSLTLHLLFRLSEMCFRCQSCSAGFFM